MSTLMRVKNVQTEKCTFYQDSVRISEEKYYTLQGRAWRVDCLLTKTSKNFIRHYTCIRLKEPVQLP